MFARIFGRLLPVSLVLVCGWSLALAASGGAVYLGGTLVTYPVRHDSPLVVAGRVKAAGTFDLASDAALIFEGGRWGSLSIPYRGISVIQFGLGVDRQWNLMPVYGADRGDALLDVVSADAKRRGGRGLLVVPWDPFDQFTDDAHLIVTIAYVDADGLDQTVAFEIDKHLVRPTLERLEQRTAKLVAFLHVEACLLYKSREACGYGHPSELKGLSTAVLDPGITSVNKELILKELSSAGIALRLVPDQTQAQIFIAFESASSIDPQCPCEGGRGVVSIDRDGQRRVVLVTTDRKKGIWGKKPAISFGKAFVTAYKAANAGASSR